MQKTILTTILSLVALKSILFANELLPDQIIKLDGKIAATQESEQWLKITVPFLINQHPDLLKLEGKKPESLEEMFNPDFISGIKIRLWISFMNEFNRSALRGDKKDVRYFEYFSAEIDCLALEIDRKTKRAEFLFPSTIAKMMELGNYPKLTGYVVEFVRDGEVFEISESVSFLNYDKEEYLEKYRMEAVNKSSENEGILIPAHQVDSAYLNNLGPVVRN
ncbi:MAG: hypothetical protein O2908_04200 [Verrucomicrobia bacterium]|nr:hypothetical protein [Verrucomicrobiota bacterium]